MGGLENLLPIIIVLAVFWYLVVRPQQQRAKQQRAMLDALAAGDEIVTVGGIYGTVIETGERVRVRVFDGSEIELAPMAVSRVIPAAATPADDESAAEEPDADISQESALADGAVEGQAAPQEAEGQAE